MTYEAEQRADAGKDSRGKTPQLILYSSDARLLEKLTPFSSALPYLRYEIGHGPQVTTKVGLDALWVTLMAAVEFFGASPPFPIHEARILKTPSVQVARGFPKYGVTGVATLPNDPRTPEFNVRLVVSALLKAVKTFNAEHQDQVVRIGIQPDDLDLSKVKPEIGFKIIQEEYGRV